MCVFLLQIINNYYFIVIIIVIIVIIIIIIIYYYYYYYLLLLLVPVIVGTLKLGELMSHGNCVLDMFIDEYTTEHYKELLTSSLSLLKTDMERIVLSVADRPGNLKEIEAQTRIQLEEKDAKIELLTRQVQQLTKQNLDTITATTTATTTTTTTEISSQLQLQQQQQITTEISSNSTSNNNNYN